MKKSTKPNSVTIKRIIGNLFLILLSLGFLFVILETAIRLIEKRRTSYKSGNIQETWAIYDEDLGYRLRPNHADFNSDGLRDDPINSAKTDFRIIILGDSIPFNGESIADTYVGRLEGKLNSDPELVRTEVINAGIKGYTNYQELVYLKKYGLRFRPDLVGVSFCLNDLHMFLHHFEFQNGKIIGESYQFTEEAVQSVGGPFYRIARRSHFLVWLRHKLTIFDKIIELKTGHGYSFEYRPDFNTAWKDEPWNTVHKQLQEMIALGKDNNFKIFLVVFPFGEQLRREYLEQDFNYVTKPQRKLKAICEELDIPLLDLFHDLDRKKHLLPDQIHLTAEGRKLVANKITTFLVKESLIPTQHSFRESAARLP